MNPILRAGAKYYACEIKETTNGGRRGLLGQARTAVEIFFARRIAPNVQVNEPKRTSARGQDKAQKVADQKTKTQVIAAY